jgi:hypothetical protein
MPRTFRPKRQRRPSDRWPRRDGAPEPKRGRYATVDSSELGDGFSPSHDWRPRHVFERIDPRRIHQLGEDN